LFVCISGDYLFYPYGGVGNIFLGKNQSKFKFFKKYLEKDTNLASIII
jgi:hypothetical protein